MPKPRLHIVLGDQLDIASTLFDGFDDAADFIWMGETVAEATHVWCHKLRLAFFFSAMRHFRDELRRQGRTVHYRQIDVSTVKELVRRWRPDAFARRPDKKKTHRALDDIRESIAELRYYRETVFGGRES